MTAAKPDGTKPCYLLVCGGRHYGMTAREIVDVRPCGGLPDEPVVAALNRTLDAYGPVGLLLTGGCRSGADMLAAKWSDERGIPLVEMPGRWKALGKAAGPRRNGWLLEFALSLSQARGRELLAVAFPGGNGTADMVRRLKAAGVDVLEVDP